MTVYIKGIPKAQPRKRHTVRGGKVWAYDPGSADCWKSAVWAAFVGLRDNPIDCPVRCDITFLMPRPKSHYRKDGTIKENAPVWHSSKPDRDNLDKTTLDAITRSGYWKDDKLVCCGEIQKIYDSVPGAIVDIIPLNEWDEPLEILTEWSEHEESIDDC